MIRISGSAFSHLPMTTFCWLPPERLPTFWLREGVLTLISLMYWSAISFSTFVLVSRPRRSFGRLAMLMLALMVKSSVRPSILRSSVKKAMPCFFAAAGVGMRTFWPWTYTSQDVM